MSFEGHFRVHTSDNNRAADHLASYAESVLHTDGTVGHYE
jgi:hypothetical protein